METTKCSLGRRIRGLREKVFLATKFGIVRDSQILRCVALTENPNTFERLAMPA